MARTKGDESDFSERSEESHSEQEQFEASDREENDAPVNEEEDDDEYGQEQEMKQNPLVAISRSGRKVVRPKMWVPGGPQQNSGSGSGNGGPDDEKTTFPLQADEYVEDEPEESEADSDGGYSAAKKPTPGTRRTVRAGRGRGRVVRPLTYEEYLAKFLPSQTASSNIFCCICASGESPLHNRVVLCDNCDSPYHQHCHIPAIDDPIAEEPGIPWYCHNCASTEKAQRGYEITKQILAKRTLEAEERRRREEEAAREAAAAAEAAKNAPPVEEPAPEELSANPTSDVPSKKRPGRPRKHPLPETPVFKKPLEKKDVKEKNPKIVDENEPERCICCGIQKFNPAKLASNPSEENSMALDAQPEPAKVTPPQTPIHICEALLKKMCETCFEIFSKQFVYLQKQPADLLLSLVFQTSIRYNQLSDLLASASERDEPLKIPQLLAYSARSRYIALPTTAAIKMLSAPASPFVKARTASWNHGTPTEVHSDSIMRRRTPASYGSYEDMIARALLAINSPRGCKPKEIFAWMEANIPGLSENFRASATQALKKGVDKTRFLRIDNGWYKHNEAYEEPLKKQKTDENGDVSTPIHERKDDRAAHQATAAALASMGNVMQHPGAMQGVPHPLQPGLPQGMQPLPIHPGFQLPHGIPPHMMMHPQHFMHYPAAMHALAHQQQWQEQQESAENNDETIF